MPKPALAEIDLEIIFNQTSLHFMKSEDSTIPTDHAFGWKCFTDAANRLD